MTGTNELAVRNGQAPAVQQAALAIQPGQVTWDKFQDAALAQIGLKDASNADKAVFLHQCQRTGLDPFARQIYMIPRKEWDAAAKTERVKWTIQTGIEGWRVIRTRAERAAGVRASLGRSVFYDAEGNEYKVWVRQQPPAACEITLTVYDTTGGTDYTSVLRFDEYVQLNKDGMPVAQWKTKPVHMLEKCTEADVYRKAFPQDFAGIYLDDAMPPGDAPAVQPERQRITAEQIRERRQTVTATVVTPNVPPAAGSTPAAAPPGPPAEPAGGTSTPAERPFAETVSAIIGHFKRLGWGDSEEDRQGAYNATARLCGLAAIANFKELTPADAEKVERLLGGFADGDAHGLLDLINDGVMPDAG